MDRPRLEELRRRVARDPASIAFAQLAEEYRRGGDCEEAIRVARAGLARHPDYVSARVTLGRALLERGRLDDARIELERASRQAPDNLAASRTLLELIELNQGSGPRQAPASRDITTGPQRPIANREIPVVDQPGAEPAAPVSGKPAPDNGEPAASVDITLELDVELPGLEAPAEDPLAGLDDWMANAPGDAAAEERADPLATLDAWLDAYVAERETPRRRREP